MAVTDTAITFAAVLEWQVPGGAARLADGGLVRFDPGSGTVTFTDADARFGTIAQLDVFETGVGDTVEAGSVSFAPAAGAAPGDWWRTDLEGTPLRIWAGEVDPADGATLIGAELVADWLVDTPTRDQGAGQDLLTVSCITVQQKLFELRQGNVLSDTHHQSIWPGERGFENCTDQQSFFAWGADAPPASGSSGGGGGGNGGGGGSSPEFINFN